MNSSQKKQTNNSFGGAEVLLGVRKEVLVVAYPFLKFLQTLTPEQLENYRSQFECLENENKQK